MLWEEKKKTEEVIYNIDPLRCKHKPRIQRGGNKRERARGGLEVSTNVSMEISVIDNHKDYLLLPSFLHSSLLSHRH